MQVSNEQMSLGSLPRITVVMPSFNQAAYLEEAICSVLDQNYPNLEFMVFDGGSTDGSVEIIQRYSDHLSYWRSGPDKGQTDALIQGFERSSGDLLGWVNSDDLLLPGALNQVAHAFACHPQGDIFGGNYVLIDEKGRVVRCKRHPARAAWFGRFGMFTVNQPGSFFTKQSYQAVGGLHRDLHYVMDNDLYVRMMINGGQYIYINSWLSGFRKHPAAKTVSQTRQAVLELERVRRLYWPPMRLQRIIPFVYVMWQTLNGNYARMSIETLMARYLHWREWSSQQSS